MSIANYMEIIFNFFILFLKYAENVLFFKVYAKWIVTLLFGTRKYGKMGVNQLSLKFFEYYLRKKIL